MSVVTLGKCVHQADDVHGTEGARVNSNLR
jgi:hypothetical protein